MSYKVTCPSNTFLCKKDIEDIIGKVNEFEKSIDPTKCSKQFDIDKSNKDGKPTDITSCPKVDGKDKCNDCDYLFENLIKGKTSCKELYEGLKAMNNSQITEQIKYNLNQLVQIRLKLEAQKLSPKFGTWDWWVRYIWTANKIQNYIYIVSFVVTLIFIIFYIYKLLSEVDSLAWIVYILLGAIILLIFIMYYSFENKPNYSIPQGDQRYIQNNKDKYPKNIRENINKDDSTFTFWFLLPFILVFIFAVGALIAKGINNKMIENIASELALYTLVAIMIAINLFYTFLIPQFLLIAIVLQKIVGTKYNTHYLGFIDISILVFLWSIAWYRMVWEYH